MDITKLLNAVKEGYISVEEAGEKLKNMPYDDLGYAMVDHHRQLRNGCPEVIYGAGKTPEQIVGITKNMLSMGTNNILITRTKREVFELVKDVCSSAVWYEDAKMIVIDIVPFEVKKGTILVVTGGTSDIPVAEEAYITAKFLGNNVERMYDVGVAGIHRILSKLEVISKANVIIVIAGMEGALASVVGGLTNRPVIAVPTSVGYGASFNGLSALLCMLNSCASGVGVVNIDNGFGAGYLANSINS